MRHACLTWTSHELVRGIYAGLGVLPRISERFFGARTTPQNDILSGVILSEAKDLSAAHEGNLESCVLVARNPG